MRCSSRAVTSMPIPGVMKLRLWTLEPDRPSCFDGIGGGYTMSTQTHGRRRQGMSANISKNEAIERVSKALDEIQFGEIIIKIQGGKPIFVDKYERERVG